jgi:hypothetical protein
MHSLRLCPLKTSWDDTSQGRGNQLRAKWICWTGQWCAAALLVAAPGFAQPQEPFPDETVAQLLTAALHQYFDPVSRFEVSASGSRLVGDLLAVDDLLILSQAGRAARPPR